MIRVVHPGSDPDPDFYPSRISGPAVKKAPDPQHYLQECLPLPDFSWDRRVRMTCAVDLLLQVWEEAREVGEHQGPLLRRHLVLLGLKGIESRDE